MIECNDQLLSLNDSGGSREGETPCSISNQEAKTLIADNTAPYWCGNVGRCQFRFYLLFPLYLILIYIIINVSILVYVNIWGKKIPLGLRIEELSRLFIYSLCSNSINIGLKVIFVHPMANVPCLFLIV